MLGFVLGRGDFIENEVDNIFYTRGVYIRE